jgi:hypothetical protein
LNQQQNDRRKQDRDNLDLSVLGKYLPKSVSEVFNEIIEGPDDGFAPPPWLMAAIKEVATVPAPTPKAPPIRFSVDSDSLEHNGRLLEEFNFDLTELLDHFADTTLGYGSEFRPTDQLDKIYAGHSNFPFF